MLMNYLFFYPKKKKKVVFPSPYPSVRRLALLGEWTQVGSVTCLSLQQLVGHCC